MRSARPQRRTALARFPNFDPKHPVTGGWSYVAGKALPLWVEVRGEDRRTLRFRPQDVHAWAHPEDGEVFVFPRYNWWNDILSIKSVDREKGIMTLGGDASYPICPADRYFVQNLLEELDAPGEWYLDRRTWTLYFWPPAALSGHAVCVPTLETIVALDKAAHVVLRGLAIECCEGIAVSLRDSDHCLVAGNTIRNVGGRGVGGGPAVSVRGGHDDRISGNDICETAGHAIALAGGDRETLTPGNHVADNNYLHHTGVYFKQGVGVSLSGVGNRASHNLIHDCPRMGIEFDGNDQVIEYNHVRHVAVEISDVGAIYCGGRDWLSPRGSIIRYNYFHDILGYGRDDQGRYESPHYAWGIYLDDNSAEVQVTGNIVARALFGLLHFHNARDNLIENNVFVGGVLRQVEFNGWPDHKVVLEGTPEGCLVGMAAGYESHVSLPVWRKYTGLQQGGHPREAVPMANNRLFRNIFYYPGREAKLYSHNLLPLKHFQCDYNLVYHFGMPLVTDLRNLPPDRQWSQWQKLGFDRHSLVADPLFIDPAHDDYRLRPDSPAFKLGFRPIPVEKIGPYADPLRATWPIVEAAGVRETGLI